MPKENSHRYTVYRIENSENDMVYVGVTRTSLRDRMYKHRSAALKGRCGFIAEAMADIGIDKFTISPIISNISSADMANDIEEMITDEYKRLCRSYNLYSGRRLNYSGKRKIGAANSTMVINVGTGDVYESITSAAKSINVPIPTLSRAISNGHMCCGFYWRKLKDA